MAAACGWLVGGIWLDAWAHHNVPTLETFFTPWHGVLYSGLLATLAVVLAALARNRAVGRDWRRALPVGYGLSLVGGLIFAAVDLVWHTLFGIEADLEALLSPPHLVLALGGFLLVGGPLRAAWGAPKDSAPRGLVGQLPALLSLAYSLSVLMFFSAFADPFSTPWPAADRGAILGGFGLGASSPVAVGEPGQALGVASILLRTALLMGAALLAIRRWSLPFGALGLIFMLNVGLAVVPHGYYQFVPVALLGGLAADALRARLRPTAERPRALRLFAFIVPITLFALYFLALALTGGVAWTISLWGGVILLAGVVGLLLSYLAVPTAGAQAEHRGS
jgi:hypothetical protein